MEEAYLGKDRTTELWGKAKATFGSKVEASGSTITLKNGANTPQILSQVTMPNATQSAAGAMSSTDKAKIDGISVGATRVLVDASLTPTGVNPVQGKAIQGALDTKLGTGATAVAAVKLATPRVIELSGDVSGQASFDGSSAASIAAIVAEMTDAEVAGICTLPSGGVEGVSEVAPVGKWMFLDPGISPATIFGGTWSKRSDTFLFMGCCVWKRVA